MTGFGYTVLGFGGTLGNVEFYEVTISSNTDIFNLETHLSNNTSYNGSSGADFFVTIDSGVVVGGSVDGGNYAANPTGIAFETGSLGTGSRLFITNNGTIIGFGGRGGTLDGNGSSTHADGRLYRQGGHGGTAFKTTIETLFTNNGNLQGGGGGGGGSAIIDTRGGSGGGGGAGAAPGLGGALVGVAGQNGNNGSLTEGGTGGSEGGRAGGTGGDPGQDGNNGTAAGSLTFPIGEGGTQGDYIIGDDLTTFLVEGTRAGGVTS